VTWKLPKIGLISAISLFVLDQRSMLAGEGVEDAA